MYILNKKEYKQIIAKWLDKFDVFAPQKAGEFSQFLPVDADSELDFTEPHNTRYPPKALFLPQSETMMRYNRRLNRSEGGQEEIKPRLIWGIRPCDAKASSLLDTVFYTEDDGDPYWIAKRDASVLVGMGCTEPCQTCFCTTVGGGPFNTDGLDALVTELGDEYYIETLTDKGERLFAELPIASEEQQEQVQTLQSKVKGAMEPVFETDNLKEHLDDIFGSDYWDTIAESCLGCGVCTFLCPTCFCFDIVDEVQRSERVRNWDTCMFRIYSQEASGHNPRPTRKERTRQRIMHKYSYWLDHIGEIGCTGCGRCVRYCPVGLDIRAMLNTANAYESEGIHVG
ncbi:MAG: 4Fe-4S dicluster domain-containing protein [Chloroflexota bacterium]|nr:4Fe-4S dicluster domain-containing protein [Chloroflexota bacterium]